MKKLTVIAIMLMICFLLNAQKTSRRDNLRKERQEKSELSKKNSPGDELQVFSKHYYTGIVFSLAGSALIISGSSNSSSEMIVAGGIVSGIGCIITIGSFSHIKKAGILLNENGIGLKIPNK